jgi:cation diffusion facilitator family transporter
MSTQAKAQRLALANRLALLSILASAVLATVKIAVGLSAHSVAVVSDGLENAADLFSSGLVLVGLWIAAKPADEDHPYGHGRFEILTGLAIGVFLAVVGSAICFQALERRADAHVVEPYAVWPLVGSMGVKGALAVAKLRAGRRAGSSGLTADAWHDMVDIISGVVALGAVLFAAFGSGAFAAADHYGGFLVGLIVIFLGLRVARETTLQLMDTMPDEAQMRQIRASALRVPGALAVEKCFARKTGLRYHVDMHLEVDPQLTVLASHEIASQVKRNIKAEIGWVEDVLVHVEPHAARLR